MTYEDGKNGLECFRLTESGYNKLYSNTKTVNEIENLILKQFEKQNLRSGDILMIRSLNFGVFLTLNPKEKEIVNDAINSLIQKSYITYENGTNGSECLRLTELGFEKIY